MFSRQSVPLRLLSEQPGARRCLGVAVLLGLLAGILTVVQARYLSRAVADVFIGGRDLAAVQPWLFGLLITACIRAVALAGSDLAAQRGAARVKQALRRRLLEHVQALGPVALHGGDEERSGELINSAVEGVEALDAYFSQYLPQIAFAALIPLAVLFAVLPLDPVSALVLLCTAPLIPIFMVLIGNLAEAMTRRQWGALSHLSAHFLDVLQGLTTLKLFGRSREQASVIGEISDRFRDTTLAVLRVAFLSALALELVATLSTAVVAVEIGLRLLYGHLPFESAFFVLILAPEFYLPLRTLGLRFHAGLSGLTALRRILDLLDRPLMRPVHAGLPVAASGLLADIAAGPLTFEGVSYAYGPGRPALEDVSFTLAPGKRVALVGPSGAGKTTVAQLLLRFIEPASGQISVGGLSLAQVPPAAWRSQVSWVPQMPYLFYGTVFENICLGAPDATAQQVERAASLAHAHEFISELPEGYQTIIGERGARLSGGEAQRIALARAFLRDAPVVILDEATANLDPEHEALVQESTQRLLQGRTALVITHRLDTVRDADQVLVLDKGCLCEVGSPDELLARGGLYARLVQAALAGEDCPAAPPPAASLIPSTDAAHPAPACAASPIENPPAAHALEPLPAHAGRPDSVRLLAFMWPVRGWIALSVFLGFATVASGVGLMATAGWLIASAALQPSIAVLQVAVVGVRFFGLARGGTRYLERLVSHQVTFQLLARLRVWFYASLEPLAPARLLEYRSGDLLARAVADIDTLQHFYIRVVMPPAVAVMVIAGVYLLVATFDRRTALVLVACLGVAALPLPALIYTLSKRAARQAVRARADLNAMLVDSIQGLSDVLAYGQEAVHLRRLQTVGADLARQQERLTWVGGLQTSLILLLGAIAVVAVLVAAIPLVVSGSLAGVSLAVLALVAAGSFEAVAPLPLAAQHLESSLAAGRRLFEIVDASPARAEPASAQPTPLPDPHPALLVENLGHRYAQAQRPSLQGVDFRLETGAVMAVVGPSGAGKSTLINLLLGFWAYQEGEVWLEGIPLRAYGGEALRAQIGVVTQQTYLFNSTVRDNLLLARPQATQDEIERAARLAQIHDFISALPEGYNTWIGEQGLRLSGGERQRLAIARALLKDAPLLLLDEATAGLDSITERAVLQAVRVLGAGRTTLAVTHRLRALADAGEILVLRNGRVAERGRHNELLARNGAYRRLWERQSQTIDEA